MQKVNSQMSSKMGPHNVCVIEASRGFKATSSSSVCCEPLIQRRNGIRSVAVNQSHSRYGRLLLILAHEMALGLRRQEGEGTVGQLPGLKKRRELRMS